MTVQTRVFTEDGGSQHLLCVYPNGTMTLAHRPNPYGSWGPPTREDLWYRDLDPRPVEEVPVLMQDEFGEVL